MAETAHRHVQPLLQEETRTHEAIIYVMEQAGIDMVFGMPGGEIRFHFSMPCMITNLLSGWSWFGKKPGPGLWPKSTFD